VRILSWNPGSIDQKTDKAIARLVSLIMYHDILFFLEIGTFPPMEKVQGTKDKYIDKIKEAMALVDPNIRYSWRRFKMLKNGINETGVVYWCRNTINLLIKDNEPLVLTIQTNDEKSNWTCFSFEAVSPLGKNWPFTCVPVHLNWGKCETYFNILKTYPKLLNDRLSGSVVDHIILGDFNFTIPDGVLPNMGGYNKKVKEGDKLVDKEAKYHRLIDKPTLRRAADEKEVRIHDNILIPFADRFFDANVMDAAYMFGGKTTTSKSEKEIEIIQTGDHYPIFAQFFIEKDGVENTIPNWSLFFGYLILPA